MAHVLIVDDDETDRLFVKTVLERTGHELYLASNGEEALRLYLRESIEVVVTDLQMTSGHGLELIDALTALDPDASIIAISGTGPDQLDMAQMIGARATLAKPVDPQQLIDAVEAAAVGD